MSENTFDSEILSEKENIRRNLRDALTYKKTCNYMAPDMSTPVLEPIEKPLAEFLNNFRAAGGKFIPCTKDDVVEKLIQIIQGQRYSTLLNTSPNLAKYLVHHNVSFVNAIDTYYPVDAMLLFSDMLVARSGSIGVTQEVARYASLKNLAKDIIVVSRDNCLYRELEDAIDYKLQRQNGIQPSIMEFLTPTKPEDENDFGAYQPTRPRFILLMVSDTFAAHTKNTEQPKENTTENESEKVAD